MIPLNVPICAQGRVMDDVSFLMRDKDDRFGFTLSDARSFSAPKLKGSRQADRPLPQQPPSLRPTVPNPRRRDERLESRIEGRASRACLPFLACLCCCGCRSCVCVRTKPKTPSRRLIIIIEKVFRASAIHLQDTGSVLHARTHTDNNTHDRQTTAIKIASRDVRIRTFSFQFMTERTNMV